MEGNKFKTPILFLVFNRLDLVKRTFSIIQRIKPSKLFIAADGPRTVEEREKTDEVREYIIKNINWKCSVNKLFRKENLGCRDSVSSAITWFFDKVEHGIILEDDCLPSKSFFRFCQELLEKYKNDERIMQISGTNVEGVTRSKSSYFFGRVYNIWGWATWRRAWKLYDRDVKLWPRFREEAWIKQFSTNRLNCLIDTHGMDQLYRGKTDTWDYQWSFCCMINNGLSAIPSMNQITNIGFTVDGTHTGRLDKNKTLRRYSLDFPLKNPPFIFGSEKYERSAVKLFYKGRYRNYLLRLIKKYLRKVF